MRQDAPETITQKQLERDRVEEKDVTIEKLLDSARKGSADSLIERQLETTKSEFGSNFRNTKAYQGNINKLEEKRLAGNKVEDEKYKPASEISKKMRWWESLKTASSKNTIKTAQYGELDFDDSTMGKRFKALQKDDNEGEDVLDLPEDPFVDVYEDEENEKGEGLEAAMPTTSGVDPSKISMVKNVKSITPDETPTIFVKMSYDNDDFANVSDAKQSAMEKVLEIYPFLAGQISEEDFSISKSRNNLNHSDINFRMLGFTEDKAEGNEIQNPFTDITLNTKDIDGTVHQFGIVKLNPSIATNLNDEDYIDQLLADAANYIADEKGVEIPASAFSLDKVNKVIKFMYAGNETADEEEDISITEVPPEEEVDETEIPENIELSELPETIEKNPLKSEDMPEVHTAKSDYDFPIVIADIKKK
jgi:hypothetical protein